MKMPGKPALWSITLAAGALLFIVLVLPGIVRNITVAQIEKATGRKASISRVSLNPFTLSAEVTGFRLAEKGGGTSFASFSSARLRISPASISKRALIISKLQITSPSLHLVRTEPNTYNFSDLIKKKPEKEGGLLFSINNIEVGNGAIDFRDQAASRPTDHTVRRMNLSVPFISNIPYLSDIYVAPRFSALINGAAFDASGKLRPLEKAAETSFIVTLRDTDIPFYTSYLPFTIPITVESGKLTTTAEVTYRVSAKAKPEVSVSGAIGLRNLLVKARGGGPLLALGMGTVHIKRMDVMGRRFDLASLETAGMEFYPERDERGVWIWKKLFPGKATPVENVAKPEKPKAPVPLLTIGRVRSNGGKIHFRDRLPPGGFTTDLNSLNLSITGFSTETGKKAPLELSFHSSREESVAVKGDLTIEPLAITSQLDAKGIDLGGYYPYLADQLAAPITGRLDTAAAIIFTKEAGLSLDGVTLTGHDIKTEFDKKDGVKLAGFTVRGGSFSLKEKKAEVESIVLAGGDVRLSREEGGRFSFEHLLRRIEKAKRAQMKKAASSTSVSYHIGRFEGEGMNITFTDRTREGAPSFPLRQLRFTFQGLTGPKAETIPFTLASGYGKRGSIGASGTILPLPLKLRGNIDLKRIPLRDFDAYLPDNLAVSVAGGALDSRLNFDLSKPADAVIGTFGGALGVRSFYCLDTKTNEDLLKWERLQLNALRGVISPFSLNIGDVSLTNYYSRIAITKNGTLNLQNLREEKPVTPSIPPRPAQNAQPAPTKTKPSIRIGTVTLQGGKMVFSDQHLPAPFTTTFYNLGGRVSGLSSDESNAADVDLRGNLENHSPLSITGSINPLRKDLFVNLTIDFSDIELTPATPYTGTYLGYTVDKGKLSLKLKYHIENKQLTSENKIFFDQLTFGKKVESDKATGLPVRLAVALLKDRKGEIHLDLPVTGRTDDPKFSIWGLVFQVLKNLLVKAATSPFALIQAAFGGKEDFSGVNFSPGSTQISPPEQEKLMNLAKAIQDRPGLNVEISGYVDKAKDPEGYRKELLLKKMRTEKFLALVKDRRNSPGQTPETTEISAEEYPVYLKSVYRKEKFSKPRNLIGLAKDLPAAEMEKLIFTHTVVGEAEFQSLARERAAAVHTFLVEKGKVENERVFLKSGDIYKSPGEGKGGSRVEFGAVVK
jgi:uncharacterized protein involved in outer membrane biogenesis